MWLLRLLPGHPIANPLSQTRKKSPYVKVLRGVSKGSWKNHWKLALFPCFALILVHSTGQVCHCRARATSSAVWIQVINRSCHSRSFRPLKRHGAGNSLVNWRRLKSRHDRLNSHAVRMFVLGQLPAPLIGCRWWWRQGCVNDEDDAMIM